MSTNDHTIVVTDHDFEDLSIERGVLGNVGEIIELSEGSDDDVSDAIDVLSKADAVLNLRYELNEEHIAAMDQVQVISRYGIGVDNIDVEAATDRGIPVTNVPTYCLEEVATHSLTLMLSIARGVAKYSDSVARGEWDRSVAAPMHRFSMQTVGVVGYGAIGREVGGRADALGADVIASDPYLTEEDIDDDPASLVSYEELLEQSDFVTVHSPLTDQTRGMLDADAFERMRPNGVLVNVARGPIVDGDALLNALNSGEIAAAGLDVFPDEPPAKDDPLRTHDDVLATPHIAWYSEEANDERRHTAARIVKSALIGDDVDNIVNSV